jgi:hypothetical protein
LIAVAEVAYAIATETHCHDFSEASIAFCGPAYDAINFMSCAGLSYDGTPILMEMLCKVGAIFKSAFEYNPAVTQNCQPYVWSNNPVLKHYHQTEQNATTLSCC